MPVERADPSAFRARLDLSARAALDGLGTVRRHRRGSTVLAEGDTGETVLLVLSGRLKVLTTTTDGRELVLALRGPGELLGELSAVAGDRVPRPASVVALDEVQVRAITGDAFRTFLADHPSSALVLLETLVSRLRDADRQRVEFGSLDVAHRLARLLVDLAGPAPDRTGPIEIEPPLTQEELAGMVSTSRETLVRALGTLRRLGMVATGRRSIAVLDLERLRVYAGSA